MEALKSKYELTKQNAEYLSTPVDYLKVIRYEYLKVFHQN